MTERSGQERDPGHCWEEVFLVFLSVLTSFSDRFEQKVPINQGVADLRVSTRFTVGFPPRDGISTRFTVGQDPRSRAA